jgi:hypothetical protein
MPANHADTQPLSKRVGGTIRQAAVMGQLTDALVASGDTMALLDANILGTQSAKHADQQPMNRTFREAVKRDQNINTAAIAPLTTVDALVALTDLGTGTRADLLGD